MDRQRVAYRVGTPVILLWLAGLAVLLAIMMGLYITLRPNDPPLPTRIAAVQPVARPAEQPVTPSGSGAIVSAPPASQSWCEAAWHMHQNRYDPRDNSLAREMQERGCAQYGLPPG